MQPEKPVSFPPILSPGHCYNAIPTEITGFAINVDSSPDQLFTKDIIIGSGYTEPGLPTSAGDGAHVDAIEILPKHESDWCNQSL